MSSEFPTLIKFHSYIKKIKKLRGHNMLMKSSVFGTFQDSITITNILKYLIYVYCFLHPQIQKHNVFKKFYV